MVEIKYKKLNDNANIPSQANKGDAGWDLRALEDTRIPPYASEKVRTGLAVEVPEGYELQIRGKSGLALNRGLSIAQGVGTIDSGYRGEVCVLVRNQNNGTITIRKSDMLAQAVLNQLPEVEWKLVAELSESERGEQGFGSTEDKEQTKITGFDKAVPGKDETVTQEVKTEEKTDAVSSREQTS